MDQTTLSPMRAWGPLLGSRDADGLGQTVTGHGLCVRCACICVWGIWGMGQRRMTLGSYPPGIYRLDMEPQVFTLGRVVGVQEPELD